MCQIHLILNTKGNSLTQEDYNEFEKLMCFGSMKNKDAFGVFNSSYSFKQGGIFQPHLLNKSKILNDTFVVGHNRLATGSPFFGEFEVKEKLDLSWGGLIKLWFCPWALDSITKKHKVKRKIEERLGDINHHPFELGDFILVHNGVINNAETLREKFEIKSNIKTDSYVVLYLINHFFNKDKEKDRVKRISNAIRHTSKQISGWWSIFLYDKRGKNLIYFKDNCSDFNLYRIGDTIVGSTDEKNLKYVYSGKKPTDLHIESDRIYLISNESYPLKVIGDLDYFSFDSNKEEEYLQDIISDRLGFVPNMYMSGDKVYIIDEKDLNKAKLRKEFKNVKEKKGIFNKKYVINKSDIDIKKDSMKKEVNE